MTLASVEASRAVEALPLARAALYRSCAATSDSCAARSFPDDAAARPASRPAPASRVAVLATVACSLSAAPAAPRISCCATLIPRSKPAESRRR
jgi:hypothetical protein